MGSNPNPITVVSIDPDAVEHIPAEAASTYAKVAARYGAAYYRDVAETVGPHLRAGERLLDAGTGPGLLAVSLADRIPGLRIHAFDITAELLEYGRDEARSRGLEDRLSFFAADCYAIPARDSTYAAILSTGVLHSLDDPGAALAECYRVLEPGGTAWVFDPTIFDLPEELDIELTDHEREVFEEYGVERGGDERPVSVAEARQLVADSPFDAAEVDTGEQGDLRLTLSRAE